MTLETTKPETRTVTCLSTPVVNGVEEKCHNHGAEITLPNQDSIVVCGPCGNVLEPVTN